MIMIDIQEIHVGFDMKYVIRGTCCVHNWLQLVGYDVGFDMYHIIGFLFLLCAYSYLCSICIVTLCKLHMIGFSDLHMDHKLALSLNKDSELLGSMHGLHGLHLC